MKSIKFIIPLIFLILLSSFTLADYTYYKSNTTMGDSNYENTVQTRGFTFVTNFEQTLQNATINTNSTATRIKICVVVDCSAGIGVVAVANITSYTAFFSGQTLNASTKYYAVIDGNGGSYKSVYRTAMSYPITNPAINFTNGYFNNAENGEPHDLWSIGTRNGTAPSEPDKNNTIALLSRTPSDITSSSAFNYANNTFIFQYFNTSNLSTNYYMNYTGYNALNSCYQISNGTCTTENKINNSVAPVRISNNTNQSANVTYVLTENQLYPEIENFNLFNNTYTATNITLTGLNDWHKESFLNFSTNQNYTLILETSLNTTGVAKIFLANSSFTEGGNPATNTNAYELCNILSTTSTNHTHSGGYGHYLCFANVVNGKINNFTITNELYILTHNELGTLNIRAITSNLRTNSARTSLNNGVTWSDSTNQYAHLHMFNPSSYFQFYASGTLTNGSLLSSQMINDTFDIDIGNVTNPQIYNPVDFNNTGSNLVIGYLQATSPYAWYNISLLNSDLTENKTIITNNSNSLTYNWLIYNESNTYLGNYYIKVVATLGGESRFDIEGVNITRNARVNITAISKYGATPITSFSGYVYHLETGTNTSYSTTTGQALVDTFRGNISIYIDADNYSIMDNITLVGKNISSYLLNQQFSLYPTNTINISFWKANNNTIFNYLDGTIYLDIISDIYSANLSTASGDMNITLLQPAEYTLRYWITGWETNFYYLTLTNRSFENLKLYLMPSNLASNITIYVLDQNTIPVSGAFVKALRYDLTSNSYIVQSMGETNSQGSVNMDLQKDTEFYKFIVELDEETLTITTPSYLTTDSYTIQVVIGSLPFEEFEENQNFEYSLNYNNASNNFRYDYNDVEGVSRNNCVYVYQANIQENILINSSCSTSSAGTILVGLTPLNNTMYVAKAYYYDGAEFKLVAVANYEISGDDTLGVNGLFLQILLSALFGLFFLFNPVFGAIMLPISLVLGRVIGLNSIPYMYLFPLVAVGFIIAYLLSKGDDISG